MLKLLIHAAENVARLARTAQRDITDSSARTGDHKPVSDSAGTLSGTELDLGADSRTAYGLIVDAIPLARCYRVQPDAGGPTIVCAKATGGPIGPIGMYDADTLVVGTHVRFMCLPGATTGLIIASEPIYMTDPTKCFGDRISMGSNTGLMKETGPQSIFDMGGTIKAGTLSLHGGITDWSGRTAEDSLEIGEFNRNSELGLMFHGDSYMAFMRADEYTGIWCFYWDGLCRIAGQQFQGWEGPSEREVYDDEGETVWYHGVGTYPWEHMGMLAGPTLISHAVSPDNVQNNYQYYAAREPDDNDIQPFHRFRIYRGYLGQGEKKLVCCPAPGVGGNLQYSDDTYQAVGLFEEQITMAGRWGVRTALGFTLAKRPIIPVPKRKEIVTSENGDTPSNYRMSGHYAGGGAAHLVQATPTQGGAEGSDEKAFYASAAVMDLHAHLFNWEGQHPFHYHSNDFFLPEEDSYSHVASNQEVPTWTDLDAVSTWYLTLPSTDNIVYDHRTPGPDIDVYRNTAYFTITDEGAVLIGDGFGSEIRMAGGCIFLQCPGDVMLEAGRNIIAWGGRDICLRAWNCVDITASERDVRIKAEKNLNMLAASSGGNWGMLFETRSDISMGNPSGEQGKSLYGWEQVGEDAQHTGIVFKAKNSEIVSWSRNYYVMTNMSECLNKAQGSIASIPAQVKEGDIVFDTKGRGDIITRSMYVKHWVQCAVMHAFPDNPTIQQVNLFTAGGATLCGSAYIDGDLLTDGSHLVRDDVISCGGHFYSTAGGMVQAADTSSACSALDLGRAQEATLRSWSDTSYGIDMTAMWYAAGRPGNPDVVRSAWFDLRTMQNYRTQDFTLWESRWSQLARIGGASAGTRQWTENPVETQSLAHPKLHTYPLPGYEKLAAGTALRRLTPQLHNLVTGEAVDRGANYEAPLTLDTASSLALDGNYYHIGK